MNAEQQSASFEVCGRCYELRGPFDYAWKGTHYTLVQECRCEGDARPNGVRPPTWIGFDFNTGAELCYCCGVELLKSGSRWSVWFCTECKARAIQLNREAGMAVVPIGRHSLMHGFGLSPESAGSREIGQFVTRLGNLVERIDLLYAWSHEVVHRNLTDTGLDRELSIAVPLYLGAVADLDRRRRFGTMLEWLVDRADRSARPTGHDAAGEG